MVVADLPNADVPRLHQEWEEIHSILRAKERLLSEAVERYARGLGPRPDDLMNEVQRMRMDCAARFRSLMDALRSS